MRRAKDDADELAGHDSFLDVVTNIVGILILLVMVVGLRSSHAVATAVYKPDPATPPPATEDDVREAIEAAAKAEQDVRDLMQRTLATHDEALLREQERHWLNTAVAEAEAEIAARRAELNTEDRRDYDLRRKITEAQVKLEELTREQIALLSQEPAVEEIECEPTPLGKVVTGREVHLLLADDHLAVVPFEKLLELMTADARASLWRLKQEDRLVRTVGPVDGFRCRYMYVKTSLVAPSESGRITTGSAVVFSQCEFLPVSSPIGEPAEAALLPESGLARFLRRVRPGTTVTIWTYPGNYDRLREIKRVVREFGFQTAVRPLPPGMPIGASRDGSDSVSD